MPSWTFFETGNTQNQQKGISVERPSFKAPRVSPGRTCEEKQTSGSSSSEAKVREEAISAFYEPLFQRLPAHMAPFRFSTVITVLYSIFTSSQRLQLQIYCLSSFTTSSKFVISLRPLTCHMPVMPGFTAKRIL